MSELSVRHFGKAFCSETAYYRTKRQIMEIKEAFSRLNSYSKKTSITRSESIFF